MDLLCFFCLVFAMCLCTSVFMCFVVTCWEKLTSWHSFVVSGCDFSLSHLIDCCSNIMYYFDMQFKTYFTHVLMFRVAKSQ